ncbi:MAG: GNAT family N-acetyltransferase [Solirubrobacteraceae bacterium]
MASFPTLQRPLRGDVAALRHIAERDIPEILIAHQDDASLAAALGQRRPPSGAELGRGIEQDPADRRSGTGAQLTVVAVGGDECCGQVRVRGADDRAELEIWVAPGMRRRGLGSDALRLAVAWLLGDCGLQRVALSCEPDNLAVLSAARAAGFVHEGALPGGQPGPAGPDDMSVLSLLASDLAPPAPPTRPAPPT